ncbi:hypothetical protein SLEP1_g59159 [Rubroshorea leprosula]|uniref:Uncharacterized protein n=1 Tax=Rubroshorea leprosula TaxID=152421 RepID=A0AAV5MRH9_9ROSI|nr:hypothetical protein SLEP1_g59159 [Rubroshorea leprosula]
MRKLLIELSPSPSKVFSRALKTSIANSQLESSLEERQYTGLAGLNAEQALAWFFYRLIEGRISNSVCNLARTSEMTACVIATNKHLIY